MSWMIIVGIPIVRSLAGWLENALADHKITWPEVTQVVKTILKIGVPGTLLFYGLNVDLAFAVTIPALVDYALNWIKKSVNPVPAPVVQVK